MMFFQHKIAPTLLLNGVLQDLERHGYEGTSQQGLGYHEKCQHILDTA